MISVLTDGIRISVATHIAIVGKRKIKMNNISLISVIGFHSFRSFLALKIPILLSNAFEFRGCRLKNSTRTYS